MADKKILDREQLNDEQLDNIAGGCAKKPYTGNPDDKQTPVPPVSPPINPVREKDGIEPLFGRK